MVLGVMRVRGAEVGGHHPAPADRAGVGVDGRLDDLFVQAALVGSAARGVGEVAAGLGEKVAVREHAAHHVHHGDGLDGGQGGVDERTHPCPNSCGRCSGALRQPCDGVGPVGSGRRVPPGGAQLDSDRSGVRFGERVWSAAWQAIA
ncbi:hypothetical protein [Streptomyces roseus]|uniref:hypothetical protein n=1 Tax=Streptomyces roseus TaxID=66430 RepID=UPI001FD75B54|nr:hypothetical protein [Streptomyces roseus]